MMTRRTFAASIGAPLLALPKKSSIERPNVLFIGSDDCRAALGCYGHPVVKTPHIDAIAARGLRFDRAYCNFPLCGPSRVSLLSGKRPDSTRVFANQISVRDKMPDAVTLPQLLRQSGWESTRLGKMYHMDVPGSVGKNDWDDPPSWDRAVSPPGAELKTEGERRNVTPGYSSGNAFEWIAFRGDGKDQADQSAADQAVELITSQRSKPFFLGLGFLRPHVPLVAPARFFDLYPLDRMPLAENPADDLADIPRASELAITGRGGDMKMNDRDKREVLRAYYASISYMDSLVGQVVSALEKQNLRNRTLIAFWSDHGYHLGEHFRWQKRSLFEESARVPLILSSPDAKARGKSTRALVELVDLYPTVAEVCGVKPPGDVEGQSLVPLLNRPNQPGKKAVFQMVTVNPDIEGRAARTERWRYIRWTGSEAGEELYDTVNDPREFTNLALSERHREPLALMRRVLDEGWRAARASFG
jgi:iduronate 2-sulfatase